MWQRRIDCKHYSACLGRILKANTQTGPEEFDCSNCDRHKPDVSIDAEAGRAANLWLSVFSGRHQSDETLELEMRKPPPKAQRKPKRRLEKIADLAIATINGHKVLCSELGQGGYYVLPGRSAGGEPLFELYMRRKG